MRQRERGGASPQSEELSSDVESRLVSELYEKQQAQLEKTAPPQTQTVEGMKQRLAVAIPVDDSELRALARQRAEQVGDELIEGRKLAEERVFLLETDLTASGNEEVRSLLTILAGA